jgi:hypothetical protein
VLGDYLVRFEKVSVYFAEPGPENTDEVMKAVAKRIEKGDIKIVVVASTSGSTGVKFANALKGKANVVVVSHREMEPDLKEKIINLGGAAVDKTHLPLQKSGMDGARETLRTLGQGFKVAVEVILIATDKALIKPYKDVIGVGGTGGGADTAIVARSTTSKEVFSGDSSKKLEVREIIAMSLKKKWWD